MGTTIKKLNVKISADNSKLKSGLKQSTQSVNNFSSSLKKMGGVLAGAFAITKVASFFKSTIKLYGIQEQAEKKLADSIAATGGEVDKLLPRYKKLASEIQNVTTVGDEVTLGLIALGKQMGISDAKMEEATKGAIGLSKAFGIDLNTSMKMVAAGIQGDTTLLNRYIPQLRFATTQTEKMSIMNTAMANGWVVATGEAETFTGKMEQLSNTLGDVQEGIGKALAETLQPALEDFSTWVQDNQEGIIAFFGLLTGSIVKAAQATMGLSAAFAKSFTQIAESGINDYISEQKKLIMENSKALGKYRSEQISTFKANILEPFAKAQKEVNDTAAEMILTMFGLVELTKEETEAREKAREALEKHNKAMVGHSKLLKDIQKEYDNIDNRLNKVTLETAFFEDAQESVNDELKNGIVLGGEWVDINKGMADAVAKAAKAATAAATKFGELTDDIFNISSAFADLIGIVNEDLGEAFGNMGAWVANAMTDWKGFTDALKEKDWVGMVTSGIGLAIAAIDLLSKAFKGFLSGFEESEDSKRRTEETNKKNEEQIRKQLEALGLTEEQMKKVSNLYIDGVLNVEALVAALTGFGFSIEDIIASIPKIGTALEGESGEFVPQEGTAPPDAPGRGFATGANFVVPRGFDNDTFPMRVSSGEHVTVIPQGESDGGDMNFDITLNIGSGTNGQELARQFIQELRLNRNNLQKEIRAIV